MYNKDKNIPAALIWWYLLASAPAIFNDKNSLGKLREFHLWFNKEYKALHREDVILSCCVLGLDNYLKQIIVDIKSKVRQGLELPSDEVDMSQESYEPISDFDARLSSLDTVGRVAEQISTKSVKKLHADTTNRFQAQEERREQRDKAIAEHQQEEICCLVSKDVRYLDQACLRGHVEVVRELLQYLAYNKDNFIHALKNAVSGGHLAIFKLVLAQSNKINNTINELDDLSPSEEINKIIFEQSDQWLEKGLNQENKMAIAVAEQKCMANFHETREDYMKNAAFFKRPFQKSDVKDDWTLSDVLVHALYSGKSHTRSRQVLQELKWLTKDGQITDSAPLVVELQHVNLAPKLAEKFHALYNKQLASEKIKHFGFYRTNVEPHWDLDQIIEHGQKASNRTRQVLVRMRLMTSEGNLTDVIDNQLNCSDNDELLSTTGNQVLFAGDP